MTKYIQIQTFWSFGLIQNEERACPNWRVSNLFTLIYPVGVFDKDGKDE